nr:hypothetical protein [Granulosicoccus sp.]
MTKTTTLSSDGGMPNPQTAPGSLKRSLNLPLLVLYGLGTTIGAGIYVLVGAAAGEAGIHAPLAFLIAAISVAPTAACYAELCGRFPVSAGEAAFVSAGFGSRGMTLLVGWLVILSGIVASATIAIGCAGYIRTFVDLPANLTIVLVIVAMGLIATRGILESVLFASLLTLIEAGGLLALVYFGFSSEW